MKINNTLKIARWENIPCKCDMSNIEKCYPIGDCIHCKCKECWDSVPQKNFKINDFDSKGKLLGIKTVKEITLVRGSKYQDVIGWQF
jgi:hypothetical protein